MPHYHSEWQRLLAEREKKPKVTRLDYLILYCETGLLSAKKTGALNTLDRVVSIFYKTIEAKDNDY